MSHKKDASTHTGDLFELAVKLWTKKPIPWLTVMCHTVCIYGDGRSSLTNEKDHHYFLNRFVCVGEFFDD